MNIDQARFNMVEQQIRPWEVLDQAVLDLLFTLRREEFVPPVYRGLAFADMEIPLGHGETMLSPKMEARIVQELKLKNTDKVLEVGTGSGYMTALMARLAKFVHSVEIVPELFEFGSKNLRVHDLHNVLVEQGDGACGWARHAPYDVIVLTGSTPVLAPELLQQLSPGGRMFAVIGEAPVMKATLFTVSAQGGASSVELLETCIASLRNAPQPSHFVF